MGTFHDLQMISRSSNTSPMKDLYKADINVLQHGFSNSGPRDPSDWLRITEVVPNSILIILSGSKGKPVNDLKSWEKMF
jgi:hypothetical protein